MLNPISVPAPTAEVLAQFGDVLVNPRVPGISFTYVYLQILYEACISSYIKSAIMSIPNLRYASLSKPECIIFFSIVSCIDLSTHYVIHESFDLLANNKNGFLDRSDFSNPNQYLNDLLQSIWVRIVAEFDMDGDKYISKNEFFLGFNDNFYDLLI